MSDAASRLVGTSVVMEEVRALIRTAACSREPVLLSGEVGTGRQLAARTIHVLSARSAAPFMRINCGGLPEGLFECELYGVMKRAFSDPWKPGQAEQAEGGTLFFDEVGVLSSGSQARLLRLIQEKQYTRLGETEARVADVRVMASTYGSLPERVKAGSFREDLYASLSAVQIALPRLRDRPGDLELLVRHFLSRFGPTYGHQHATVTPGALTLLAELKLFGNVRDLENYIEMLLVKAPPGDFVIDEAAVEQQSCPGALPRELGMEPERDAVEEAIKNAGGNRSVAARMLGVSRRTLYNKLVKLGLAP